VHSISGGTGAGLTGLLLKTLYDYLDKGSKCVMQNFVLMPSPGVSDVLIEPYFRTFFYKKFVVRCISQMNFMLLRR